MDSLNIFLLAGTGVLFVGLLLGSLSSRIGVPALLVFLLVGMVAGEDGLVGIQFDDFSLSYVVGNIALAIILLDGGLRTHFSTFRLAFKPALTLATLGVGISAGLVGAFATWLMGIDWRLGLLLGGIVGSTDAAAVFNVIKGAGVTINERVAATLEVESGLNDPMAIFITLLLISLLVHPEYQLGWHLPLTLIREFGLGMLMGLGLGAVLSEILLRVRSNEGLHALLLCSGGAMVFAVTNLAGGSGFLAIYLAGLVAGNHRGGTGDNVLRSMDTLAWLAQSGMFLMLGLLINPSELGNRLLDALLVAFFLMLVARPVAVGLCLIPFRFNWREKLFIAWTGLRGAVPIVLAVFPLLAGVAQTRLLFDITLVVVLISLLAQGVSLRYMARLLKVAVPATTLPRQMLPLAASGDRYIIQFEVAAGAKAEGQKLAALIAPRITPLLVIRNQEPRNLAEDPLIEAGDLVTWLAPVGERDYLSDLCHKPSRAEKRYFGEFFVRGSVPAEQLVAVYGTQPLESLLAECTVETVFQRQFGRNTVVGDTVSLGGIRLRARTVEKGRVVLAGIKLPA